MLIKKRTKTKIKKNWLNFFSRLKRLFKAPKNIHIFRKRLVLGIILGIIFLIMVWVVIFGIGLYKYNWKNKPAKITENIIPYPAAFVGSNIILLRDYDNRVVSLEHYYGQLKQNPTEDYKQAVLEGMINHKILEREARRAAIFVTDKEIEDTYQELIAGEGGEEQVKKILSELWGYDISYFKSLIKEKLLEEKVKKEIPASFHLKHILLKLDPNADANFQAEILKKAEGFKVEILAGKSFLEEAKLYSEDAATKDNGGDLGWLYIDQVETLLGKDCLDKITNLKTSSMDICRSYYGFDIVLLDEKKGKINKSYNAWFEEVKNKTKIWRFVGK